MHLLPRRSAFCDHVCHVLALRACAEVSRVAADSIVTRVQDNHAIGDWAVRRFVRKVMGVMRSCVSGCSSVSPDRNRPIPRPACVGSARSINSIEYRSGIVLLRSVVTGAGAELRVSARRSLERFPALLTHMFSLGTIFFELLVKRAQSAVMRAVFGCLCFVRLHAESISTHVASERYGHSGLRSTMRSNVLNYTLSASHRYIQIHPNGQLAIGPVLEGED